LQRALRLRHHDPGTGREQLPRRRHAVEEERRERVGSLETESVGEALQAVAEPVGQVRGTSRGDRAELVVGEELPHRRDLDPAHLLGRELGRRRELAEPLDLVAPVLEPSRSPGDAGEHVDDAPADRELPSVLDHVHADVAELGQPLRERIRGQLHARRELQRRHRPQGRRHRLHRGEVWGHEHEGAACRAEASEGVGPSGRDLGRRVHPLVGKRVPCREEGDGARPEVGPDLRGELLGLPRAGRHHHQWSVEGDGEPGEEEVLSRVGAGDDRAGALQQEPLERLRRDESLEDLAERHHTSPEPEPGNANSPVRGRDGASKKEEV
jgi:hypothetical protein